MNKKHLLVAASALVVGLGFSGHAYAEWNWDPTTYSTSLNAAVAASVQAGEVESNGASGTVGENNVGTVSAQGLINVNQNNGANSLLQSQNTLGIVLTSSSCGCSTADNTFTGNGALSLSAQVASVEHNSSSGAATVVKTDSDKGGAFSVSGGGHSESTSFKDDKFSHSESGGGFDASGNWHNDYSTYSSTPVGSSNSLGTLSGVGMINVSQNNGNNSMIQSGNTAAAIIQH